MSESMPSLLTQELKKIIGHQNYLGLTSILLKFIISFNCFHLKPLLIERETLRDKIQRHDSDYNSKDEMFKKIGEINKTLEQRYFKIEFLYREYYISKLTKLRDSEQTPSQPYTDYLSLCNLQISQGMPFEIIDGNNLQFIKEVYQRILDGKMQDEEIFVVSVIGPQSSGKSLLLNTLFGTQFLSQAGRCTRGIQGCLIDVKSGVNQTHYKKILVLDSEALQSTEAIDEAFDRKLVFYMLCVSHVVLVCNKGEMNKPMEDTIKLAAHCMMQMSEKIYQQAEVNVIMNNVHTNENYLFQTIQSFSNSILDLKQRNESQRQIFRFDPSNVFLLPNAFAYFGNEEFAGYQPSYQFAVKVDQLRKKILNLMKSSYEGNRGSSYTLKSWFKFAQEFWEFTDGYSRITDYSTLEERKEDILLVEYSKKLISQHFEDPLMVQTYEEIIHKQVASVLDQHQGFDQTNINVINRKIEHTLQSRQQEVEYMINNEFRKQTDERRINPRLMKRRSEQLETQIRQHFQNWKQIGRNLLNQFIEKKSKFIGDRFLQKAINGYIQDFKAQYTFDQARIIFEKEWDEIVHQIKLQLKLKDQISEQQFYEIGQNLYRANFRIIIKIDQDRALITSYQDLNSRVILNHLHSQEGFFYSDAKAIKPSIEKLKQLLEREKYQSYFRIKPKLILEDKGLLKDLDIIIQQDKSHIHPEYQQVQRALKKLYSIVDHEKLLKDIQKIVLDNIFRNSSFDKYTTVEKLVQDLIESDQPNITREICPIDFKVVQRIANSIDDIVSIINEDIEPFQLRVSEHGRDCLHQITQTYLVRIIQEVIRLQEHAPLIQLNYTKNIQRDLFITKLMSSNDRIMDIKLAERTARHLAQEIVKDLKTEQIKAFQYKIQGEQNLFNLKTIGRNIENQVLKIVNGEIPDPFEIENKSEEYKPAFSSIFKMLLGNQEEEKKEEEKKEGFKEKMSKLNKMFAKFEFSPEEIIMFYVQPGDFLKKKFNDQWIKLSDIEIKRTKNRYANIIKETKLNFQRYFERFQKRIQVREIQLAANVFIPDCQDQPSYQQFKYYSQKAMAIYLGLVLTKEWKDGTTIQVDEHINMIHPENLSLVCHYDIGIDLPQSYARLLQQCIKNESISNIDCFIQSLISEIQFHLDPDNPQNSLQEQELIGNLYQEMRRKTLGCDQMCPICRRQCDQSHEDELSYDRIHRCEEGHQILGFGGKKQKQNNRAINIGCHEINDSDIVTWKGTDMKWQKLKGVIFFEQRWDLDDKDQGAKQVIKEKNMKIWNKIGPFICDYYRLERGINIKFQKADPYSKRPLGVQYILNDME